MKSPKIEVTFTLVDTSTDGDTPNDRELRDEIRDALNNEQNGTQSNAGSVLAGYTVTKLKVRKVKA